MPVWKERKKDCACQVWPRAVRKGHLKRRAPPHRPRGRGGTEVYTSKLASTMGPTTRLSGSVVFEKFYVMLGVILRLFHKELLISWLEIVGVGLRKPVLVLLLRNGGCMSCCQPV
eukprot:1160882-Pelagomonas_calceolata.AAC.4